QAVSGYSLVSDVERQPPRLLRPFRPRRFHWPPLASAKESRLHRLYESLSLLMHADRTPLFSKGRDAFRPNFFSQAPNNSASTLAFPRPPVRSTGAMRAFRFDLKPKKKETAEGAGGNN
ncbi:hypothetical protein, partial [Citrobacter sp. wls715]|uniref:hypothetical protein n=1 Tax=Citrobacter sp. wls715 TaxID=2576421 RepID=UPI001BAEB8A8